VLALSIFFAVFQVVSNITIVLQLSCNY